MSDSDDVNLLVPEEESDEELQLKLQAEEIKSNILKLGVGISFVWSFRMHVQ